MPPKKLPASEVGYAAPRGCTDVAFFILFVAMWGLLIFVAAAVFKSGDPNRLIYGTDINGNVCSKGSPPGKVPNTTWANSNKLWYPVTFNPLTGEFVVKDSLNLGVCVEKCPVAGDPVPTYSSTQGSSWGTQYVMFTSKLVLHRCVPDFLTFQCDKLGLSPSNLNKCKNSTAAASSLFNSGTDAYEFFESGFAELSQAALPILAACGICVVISFLWLFVLRRSVKPLVVLTILVIFALLALVIIFLWKQNTILQDQGQTDKAKYYFYGSIGTMIFTFLFLCLVLFIGKDIMVACDIIEEASKIPIAIPTMALVPVFGFIFVIPLALFNGAIAVYIQSSGALMNPLNVTTFSAALNITTSVNETLYQYQNWRTPAHIFNLLMFLWNLSFIGSMVFLVISLCAIFWYWSKPGDNKEPPSDSVRAGCRIAFRYHMGTVAFGSLLVAIVQVMRVMLQMMEKRLKEWTGNAETAKWILCCAQCCLACFEKFIKFMNKNAYIMTAMTGENFLEGAMHALSLLVANALSVGAVTIIGEWVMFFGKGIIVTISVLSGWGILNAMNSDSNLLIILVVIGILTYIIASIFINILAACIDAILLSYCYDLQAHDGSTKPYYFPDDLAKHVKTASKSVTPESELSKPFAN